MLDPLVILLLVLFVGIPLLSFGVMLLFAATADYEPEGVELRGGSLRGAVAGAVAKILVGDTKTFQLPLVVKLRKVGLLGASTPLVGGATVRDIEWRIFADGEHVSTVTEASSVHVGSRTRHLELPVNAEIHLPRGLIGSYRKYRTDRRRGHEMRIEVRGHVIVKHWWMTREMPVRVVRHVVLGEPEPVVEVRFGAKAAEPVERAHLEVDLTNPYQDEVLEGELRIELQEQKRLRRDPVHEVLVQALRVPPGGARRWSFVLESLPDAMGPEQVVEVRPRLTWNGRPLQPEPPEPVPAADEPGPPPVGLRLRVHGDPPRLIITPPEPDLEGGPGGAGPYR